MNGQLKELSTSSMLDYVSKLEFSCKIMSDPSSRHCFSGPLLLAYKNDKNLIRNCLGEVLASHEDSHRLYQKKNLNSIADVWNRKPRRRT